MSDWGSRLAIPSARSRLQRVYGQKAQGVKHTQKLPPEVKTYCWSLQNAAKYIGISKHSLCYFITQKTDTDQFVYYDPETKTLITTRADIIQQLQTRNVRDIIKNTFFSTNFIHKYKDILCQIDVIMERWSNKSYVKTDNERERLAALVRLDSPTIN
jgi:hypothetical protein